MSRLSVPLVLASCLRGELPEAVDWDALIAFANRTWLAPQLLVSLRRSGAASIAPDDIRAYLEFLHACNLARNRRLQLQLRELVRELNAVDVIPTLLKGAIDLVEPRDDELGARMIGDLDLLVRTDELGRAGAALERLGYGRPEGAPASLLTRAEDAGAVDLHGWPVADRRYAGLAGIEAASPRRAFGTSSIRVPPAHLRVLHLVIHDQVKEGDDVRGCVDLRHLWDIARMLSAGVDGRELRARARTWRERDGLEETLMLAERLFGAVVPPGRRTLVQRIRCWRRLAPLNHPVLATPLRIAGDTAWVLRRATRRDLARQHWRNIPRALRIAPRDPALAYYILIGPYIGPKT